jgi:hypothetical protein
MILWIWLASAVAVDCMFAWSHAFEDDLEFNKETVAAVFLMTMFGPISLFAIFCMFAHEHIEDKKRTKCARILAVWEADARKRGNVVDKWEWYQADKHQEERFNLLRESVRHISDKDLNTLTITNDDTYKIEKALRDAIVDEMIERKIINSD